MSTRKLKLNHEQPGGNRVVVVILIRHTYEVVDFHLHIDELLVYWRNSRFTSLTDEVSRWKQSLQLSAFPKSWRKLTFSLALTWSKFSTSKVSIFIGRSSISSATHMITSASATEWTSSQIHTPHVVSKRHQQQRQMESRVEVMFNFMERETWVMFDSLPFFSYIRYIIVEVEEEKKVNHSKSHRFHLEELSTTAQNSYI